MPHTALAFYREAGGDAPVLAWLRELRRSDSKAYAKCLAAIERLAESGHELRRPLADFLRDGIYELRIRRGHVNYRILYFFQGQIAAVLVHALTKTDKIARTELDRALRRKALFESDPQLHSYWEEFGNED